MDSLSPWIEVAKLLLDRAKKTGEIPPVDPTEIAKCVRDLQLRLMEMKKDYVQVTSDKAKLDEKILFENLRKLKRNQKFRVVKKKKVLIFPVGEEEYTYEFIW